jgi:hypothetical protein
VFWRVPQSNYRRHREERSDVAIQSRRLFPLSLDRFACARDDEAFCEQAKTNNIIIGTFCIERGCSLLHDDRDFVAMEEHLGLVAA